ncbi:MAG TPA: hypothetical protein VD735_04585 [Candidatus Saccharimonadales bacterium]|nr:hypothetical protein [Candidatus Saccharimonadales bacterium]
MEKLVPKLQATFTQFIFMPGRRASWSPELKRITYINTPEDTSLWALLHELGHALAGHTTYDSDIALIRKETEAWHKATEVSLHYNITINEEHIQQCLDTYRDWLYKRSTCPVCEGHGIQTAQSAYGCYNCGSAWQVSAERFCRPYRALSVLH